MRRTFGKGFVVAIALTAILAAKASAQSGNPFIIDGVVPANGNPGGLAPTEVVDPFGSVQELGPLNSSATKVGVIHSAAPPMLGFTNPNGQVDLRRIWLQTAPSTTNNDLWLYFAWERDKETGSGFIAFEFQQSQLSAACVYSGTGIDQALPQSPEETALIKGCNPWSGRQAGDFLILWDQSGSSTTIIKRTFANVGGVLQLQPGVAVGSAAAQFSNDGFRGEAAINLTTDVFPRSGACVNFANVIPGTVTGNSDSADYKDAVFSAFPDVSNCGIVTVTKVTEPVTTPPDATSFPYKLDRVAGDPIRFGGGTFLNDSVAHGETDTHSLLIAGTDYRLHETVGAGYELTSMTCVQGGVTYSQTANDLVFPVVASDTTACTIKNRRKQGTLRVIKHVINDNGGTATAGQFLMSLGDGSTPDFNGNDGVFGTPATGGVVFTFDEGHAFTVTESLGSLAGKYTASEQGTCTGKIVANVEQVCQITNDDNRASLTVIKQVNNDNGGTAAASNFTMSVSGSKVSSSSFPGAESPGTTVTLDAGSYSVTESSVAGYRQVSAVGCSGIIANGESKTCTITNDDQGAHLKLVKVVVNDSGGTAVATDFTLSAAGPTPFSGAGGAESDVSAGTYNLSESSVAGYTPGAWVCQGGTQNGSSVTLGVGQSATCTITNDDQEAHLKLVKVVVNDNGGTAVANDFTLTATGPTPINGAGGAESNVSAGTYNLSESSVAGYTQTGWVCVGGTQNGSSITLAPGQSATCTSTNDDAKAAPNGNTVQRSVLHDRLTITGLRTGAPNAGTARVRFRLFSNATCSIQVGATEEVGITAGVATTANGVLASANGTYYWTAEYTGDQFNSGFTTACGSETTTVTFVQ